MEILKFDTISFDWRKMLANSLKTGHRKNASEEMTRAAERAYNEGLDLLDMKVALETYNVDGISDNEIMLSKSGASSEKLYIGLKVGYLMPAQEVTVILATVGDKIVQRMNDYDKTGNYMMMYYLDVLGVQALLEVTENVRKNLELYAREKGWGVGPFMQPGAVAGWQVEGQRDLYRLANGEKIGLAINDKSFLIPNISDSAIIGIGEHFDTQKVGSMCKECPRRSACLWRRENVSD